MRVKHLKEMLKTYDDDAIVTLVTFDYETGGNEFYLNFSCTQNDRDKLRLTKGINLKCLNVETFDFDRPVDRSDRDRSSKYNKATARFS